MATAPMALDRPPALPDDVTAQMGAQNPMAGVAAMIANRSQGQGPMSPSPAAVHPQGQLLAAGESIGKVLDEMARMSDKFAPFGKRAFDIIQAGLAEAVGAPPPQTAQTPQPGSPETGTSSPTAAPPEGAAAKSFPG